MKIRGSMPFIFATCLMLNVLCSCGVKSDNPSLTSDIKYTASGPLISSLKTSVGWQMDTTFISNKGGSLYDACVLVLPDGRIRIYSNEGNSQSTRIVVSFISNDGVKFEKEAGVRINSPYAFTPYVITLPDGKYRMYMTDQTTYGPAPEGAIGIKSAISDDGLTFTMEPGDRLKFLGTGDEAGGIRHSNVIRTSDGKYRMYYKGFASESGAWAAKVLSAVSNDGLTFTRESGVRIDPRTLSPGNLNFGNPKFVLDASGTVHLYHTFAMYDDVNHKNEVIGLFESTSTDGLIFNNSRTPILQGYYIASLYHGSPLDPFLTPTDPMAVVTPGGLRIYFFCFASGGPKDEDGIYSILNRNFH